MFNVFKKLIKTSALVFLFALSGLFFSGQTYADTIINHDIEKSTRWTKAQSPYLVYCDFSHKITVDEHVTLTIDPGVTVKFEPRCGMEVIGKMNAIGWRDQRITFTSVYDNII